jgi:hypothetical protein
MEIQTEAEKGAQAETDRQEQRQKQRQKKIHREGCWLDGKKENV